MSTQPTITTPDKKHGVENKPAVDAHKATSAPAKPEPPKKDAPKVDPDKVFRADGTEDTNATKERKLKKIAARRIPQAIKALRMVGQLGAYKPNPEQQAKIVRAVDEAWTEAKRRLNVVVVKTEEEGFTLN